MERSDWLGLAAESEERNPLLAAFYRNLAHADRVDSERTRRLSVVTAVAEEEDDA